MMPGPGSSGVIAFIKKQLSFAHSTGTTLSQALGSVA